LTIVTQFGSVEIPAEPERVVVLMDDEFVVGLGVVPVAMARARNGEVSDVVRTALGSVPIPELLDVGAGYPYDQIADLEPDLIIGGVTQQTFDQLSAIAPTLAYERTTETESWQRRQLTIGRALGKEAEATALVEATEAKIAALVATAPAGLKDKTFSLSLAFGQGQISAVRNPDEAAAQLLGEFGLSLAPRSRALQNPDGSGRVTLGLESLGDLTADIALVAGLDDSLVRQITDNPTLTAALPADAAVVVIPLPLLMPLVRPTALTAHSVLSAFIAEIQRQAPQLT
jgi:iron complex transport system substrate-binding protein